MANGITLSTYHFYHLQFLSSQSKIAADGCPTNRAITPPMGVQTTQMTKTIVFLWITAWLNIDREQARQRPHADVQTQYLSIIRSCSAFMKCRFRS